MSEVIPTKESRKTNKRRDFLVDLFSVGIVLGAAGVAADSVVHTFSGSGQETLSNTEILAATINKGLAETWNDVVLFPGLIGVNPGAQFYKDPALTARAPSPIRGNQRLGILRPVLVKPSLGLNVSSDALGSYQDQDLFGNTLEDSTLGFIAPNEQSLLYSSFQPNFMEIYSREANYGSEVPIVPGILAEQDNFDGRAPANSSGIAIPYFKQIDSYNNYGQPSSSNYKLAESSFVVSDELQFNMITNNFMLDPAYEPVGFIKNPGSGSGRIV